MWQELLSDIRKIKEKYGSTLNAPASNEQIEILKRTVKEKFNHVLLEQYLNFLKTVNGLEFNGHIFYGIDCSLLEFQANQRVDGYVDSNEVWYENEHQKQYMFFGDGDIAWYCYDLLNGVYVELDKPSGTEMYTFTDFDTMLEKALKDSLL